MHSLARYTLELAPPDGGWSGLEAATARARQAAAAMRDEGTQVRFLRSIFVPEDETCFFLFEAPSAEDVLVAAGRAALEGRHLRPTIVPGQREP